MTARRIAIALALLCLAVPGRVAAQGLGGAAARERDRRAKEAQAKKRGEGEVFTNEDLTQGERPGTPAAAGEGSSGGFSPPPAKGAQTRPEAASPPDDREDGEDRRATEQPFLDAVSGAQSRLSVVEKRIQELQSKLNPMSGSFIYGATGSNSAVEEANARAELSGAEGELAAARQDLATAVEALQDVRQGLIVNPPAPR
jgi:hypothetical protein